MQSLLYSDSYEELTNDIKCSIIHLHGCVDRSGDGYIFSRNEYAKSLSRPNSWMLTLSQLIRTEFFVIAGTSLDEIDVEYYLELRGQKTVRADIPRSVLVEPYPSKLTEKLCRDHDFTLYRGTVESFLEELKEIDPKLLSPWTVQVDDGLSGIGLRESDRLRFSATFATIPKSISTAPHPARFFLGAELSWELLASNADVPREKFSEIRNEILGYLERREARLYLLVDQPGAGKTSLLKRLAYDFSRGSTQVFWYSGLGLELEPQAIASIFDQINGSVIVLVDNFADALNSILLVLERTQKRDIIFVCAERDYRLGYIENTLTGEDYFDRVNSLRLTVAEALRLRQIHEEEGISTLGNLSEKRYLSEVVGRPIAEANCRIQHNFKTIDRITLDLMSECTDEENAAFLTVALARFCFALGVRRSALSDVSSADAIEFLLSEEAPLPLKYSDRARVFVSPSNSLIGDRVLEEARRKARREILAAFVDLASSLAPRVTPAAIKRKTPEAQLLGRLMDYDNNVKRFIDDYAEEYYLALKRLCGWNARYWEQLSLLKLDRYFSSPEDVALLEESIQHARSATSAELHPFSLTTLAKVLFEAMGSDKGRRDQFFLEAWRNIIDADDRESRWPSRGATLFNVCFKGVLRYVELGGQLSGDQYERLRAMVATTHALKIRDKGLIARRTELSAIL